MNYGQPKPPVGGECPEKGQHCWNKGTGHELNPIEHPCCFCGASRIKPLPNPREDWDKEFRDTFCDTDGDFYKTTPEQVMYFIRSLLAAHKSALRAKAEEKFKQKREEADYDDAMSLEEILKLLDES